MICLLGGNILETHRIPGSIRSSTKLCWTKIRFTYICPNVTESVCVCVCVCLTFSCCCRPKRGRSRRCASTVHLSLHRSVVPSFAALTFFHEPGQGAPKKQQSAPSHLGNRLGRRRASATNRRKKCPILYTHTYGTFAFSLLPINILRDVA